MGDRSRAASRALRAAGPLVATLVLGARCAGDLVRLAPGDPAPPFSLEDLGGRPTSLAEQRGKLVLIRFWADWCKSCRVEMPVLGDTYRRYRSRGLALLALNVRQSPETAGRFARELGLDYPILLDRDGETAKAYGIVGLPTTVVVDRDGHLLRVVVGEMDAAALTKLMDSLFPSGPAGEGS